MKLLLKDKILLYIIYSIINNNKCLLYCCICMNLTAITELFARYNITLIDLKRLIQFNIKVPNLTYYDRFYEFSNQLILIFRTSERGNKYLW